MKHRTSELVGAHLDLAVALTGEWSTAHELFPTMTLDPTFSGARIAELSSGPVCLLVPRNPMRQDPERYSPSTDWGIGGPIIERERLCVAFTSGGWRGLMSGDNQFPSFGPTPLIAAMRCFVAGKLGEEGELP